MHVDKLHNSNLSYAQTRDLQSVLAAKIKLESFTKKLNLVAGLDCAFSKDGKRIGAGVVVLRALKLFM